MRPCHPLLLAAAVLLPLDGARAHSPDPSNDEASASSGILTLSGELRERVTFTSDIEFDPDLEGDGLFWTQRLAVRADADISPQLRARLTVQSGLFEGEDGNPVERNDLGIQEAFVEIGPSNAFVRLGRQELNLGSARLVSARDGTNIRRTWDGARAIVQLGAYQASALVLSEVDVAPSGIFNDPVAEGDLLAGAYLTGPAPLGQFDAYFLFSKFDDRQTIENLADQDRYTIGLRAFGEAGSIFWNWEAMYQFGSQGDVDISAWSVAANTGIRFEHLPWRPEIMLSANVASGDDERDDGTLGTFDALFPRGSYFSELAMLGPSNFYNIHPYLTVHPAPGLTTFVDVNFYWRYDRDDAIYGPPGNIIRSPDGSDARYVTTSVSAGAEWEASENILLSLLFTNAAPGRFIEETGPDETINFIEFSARYTF